MTDFSPILYLETLLNMPNLSVWVGAVLLLGLIVALVRNTAPPDFIMLTTAVIAALLGLIKPGTVFEGFSDTSMLTVAALFVVAAGLRETGALDRLGQALLGTARTEKQVMWRMYLSVTGPSAVLNNTPIVAMLIPVVTGWCKKHNVSPSRLLIPLSFFTILGGTCTLIGTSTNLVVQGLLIKANLAPMHLFDLAWVGIPYALVGGAYLLILGPRLLPNHRDLMQDYGTRKREYLVNLRVEPGCRLAGQEVEAAGLRHLQGLFLVEIVRGNEVITPVRPDRRIESGDVLTFTGLVETIVELERIPGLVTATEESLAAASPERELHEAVVSSTSPLVGRNIRDSNFRATYNAAVLAVHRGGERLKGRVGDIVLRPGDTLLLQTGPHFALAHRNNADFYLVSPLLDARPVRHERSMVSVVLLGLLVILLSTGYVSTVMAAFVVAGLMLLTRCLSVNAARQSLDLQTLLTIAASFAISEALKGSGFVEVVANTGAGFAAQLGPTGLLFLIYLLTSLFTEIVTNTAAAALMFPFAIALAAKMGVHYQPFVMAITFAASASFMTPIGYQTNLMIYGPGGYSFKDFARIGAPLNALLLSVATVLIPIFWPF